MVFTLELWKEEYIEGVLQHANNEKIAEKLRDVFPYPYTYDDAKWYVNDCIQTGNEKQLCKAIVIDNQAVGSIGIFIKEDVYEKSAELGYWLGEDYWGKKIMTRAVKQLCQEAFEQYDIVRIFAEPFAHNIGSRKVLEKAGFQLEGILRKSVYKKGNIYDSYMYALIK